ncbi:MAG TPA: VCBS repeat-containing protein [Chitinophagaceae bacterium]
MKGFLIQGAVLFLFSPLLTAQPGSRPLFTLLSSKETGINFSNEINEDSSINVLAYEYFYNGGGVAVGDINNDGLPDIFLTANTQPNKLFLNEGSFHFRDITRSAKVGGKKSWKTGVTMADINGDGWLDIYVCYSGKGDGRSRQNELYINNQDLTFSEKAKEYGIADEGCSTQTVFFDYDLDGDLDCYVLNHNIKAFKNVELHYLKNDYDSLAADRLYRNDNGKFTDISRKAGISGNPISFGLGVAVSDINNDNWPDIYVSNDYTEQDYCYINNMNGTFSQRELYMFGHLSQFSMGSDIADINNDGLVDIFTLDMLPEDNRRQKLLQAQENYELYQEMTANGFHYQYMRNMLQLNNGNGTFSEIGQLAGISNTDWSWAPLLADFDNDGYKDLYVTNGYMRDYTNKDFLKFWGDYLVKQVVNREQIDYTEIIKMMPVTMLTNYAFSNNGNLTFKNVSGQWGLKQAALSNGAAYADLDNDGDLDLIVNNINQPVFIYRNDLENSQHYFLKVKLEGNTGNRFGLGAKIFCYTGKSFQLLEQMPARGYQSSVSEVLHFGLGKFTEVDSLKIIWPGGKSEVIYKIKTDQTVVLKQEKAIDAKSMINKSEKKMFTYQKSLIDFSHMQLEYNDFKRQSLMPIMYSQCGPRFSKMDVNGDSKEDLFIGSSQGQGSELYLQQSNGSFILKANKDFIADSLSVTTDVLFFDADGDNDADIYCTSGGYNDYEENDTRLQDRLFINDGNGNFHRSDSSLPVMLSGKSCVAGADIDGDSDMDLFVGGRMVPGEYPETPQSFLLLNDGKGNFSDVTKIWSKDISFIGMVTDASWTDINKDGKPDLVIAGEWLSPTIYLNTGKVLQISHHELKNYSGWWNTIEVTDIDNDGDPDIIGGNWGLNSQIKASEKEPVELIYKDFDNNGSIDPFLCFYIQGKSYPYLSRDELLEQMYPMRRKFTSYKSYADAEMKDIFSAEEMNDAKQLKATHLQTTFFENRDGQFIPRQIPLEAQFSSVNKIVLEDFNKDGLEDILLLGNNEHCRLKMGKMDANFGTILLNDGKGNFNYLPNKEAGLLIPGDTKDAVIINVNGVKYLLAGINNSPLLTYKLN